MNHFVCYAHTQRQIICIKTTIPSNPSNFLFGTDKTIYFTLSFQASSVCLNSIEAEVERLINCTLNKAVKMFVIPSILITSPIFETEETSLPIITLSRHIEETSEDLRNGDAVSEEQFAPVNEPDSIFPRSIFDAAR